MKPMDLCCLSKPKTADSDPAPANEVPLEPIVHQPTAAPSDVAVNVPNEIPIVAPPEKAIKGHKRTPSEASAPVPPVVPVNTNPATPKVSLSGSSTSSYQSSASVVTAIQRLPDMIREASDNTSPVPSKPPPLAKDSPMRPLSSQSAEDEDTAVESSPEPNEEEKKKKDEVDSKRPSGLIAKKEQGSSQSLKKHPSQTARGVRKMSSSSDEELPRNLTSLDELDRLKEMINSEKYDVNHALFEKISFFYGDITKLEVDAIVNAANSGLSGGGGVDAAIHNAAGWSQLQAECKKVDRPVETGDARITGACRLSGWVKNIIHCVGPICRHGVTKQKRNQLRSCYQRAIQLSEEKGLTSIAFCCISTGIYGYDNKDAAETVLKFLWKYFSVKENADKWDRVVLCLFMDVDKKYYKQCIQKLLHDPTFFDKEEEDEDEEDGKKNKKDDKDENKEKKKEESGDEDEKKDKEKEEDSKDEKMGEGNSSPKPEDKQDDEKAQECPEKRKEDTVDGSEKKEEEETSPSNTSTEEEDKKDEERVGRKGDFEKENDVADGKEEVVVKKRISDDKNEDEPPIKRDKHERESAV